MKTAVYIGIGIAVLAIILFAVNKAKGRGNKDTELPWAYVPNPDVKPTDNPYAKLSYYGSK